MLLARRSGGAGWTSRPFAAGDDGAVAAFDDVGDEPVVVWLCFGQELVEVGVGCVFGVGEFFGGDHGAMDVGGLLEVG